MLNSIEVDKELQVLGLSQVENNTKIIGYDLAGSHRIYVKVSSTGKGVTPWSLVLHPENKDLRAQLETISGVKVNWLNYYHNDCMKALPERMHTGKSPINYGLAVRVESRLALRALVDFLSTNARHLWPDAETDIKHAAPELVVLGETEREQVTKARRGQGLFRDLLLNHWKACAVTGITTPELLRASHIKPWRDASNPERLDPYNGLLLSATLDAAFDTGLISFSESGTIIISPIFVNDAEAAGIHPTMALHSVDPRHLPYLQHHRDHILRK